MGKEIQDRIGAFKLGFLKKLAEDGITPSEFYIMIKQAFDPTEIVTTGMGNATEVGTKLLDTGVEVGGDLLKNLMYAGVLAPAALGGMAGAVEARLTSPSAEDIESLRNAELAAKYEQASRIIKRRMQAKQQVG